MKTIIISFFIAIMTIPSYCQIPSNIPLSGLIGWYPFNGNSNDESGNGNNPTYIGSGVTLTTDRNDSLNAAYNFNGLSGSYILIPADNFPVADRTVSLWFNVPSVSNKPALLGYGGNGNCGTSFFMSLNVSNLESYSCQGHCALNQIDYNYPSEPINNWVNYIVTIEGSLIKLYVNGELKQSANSFNSNTSTTGSDLVFGVVTYVDGQAPYTDFNINYLQGKLDDIGIWNRALTPCEINQLYTGISFATTSSEDITVCDGYTWAVNGQTYTQSGTYNHTIPNSVGCDSNITLNLTINHSATGTDTQTACGLYTWIDGVTYNENNTTATHTFTGGAMNGCDSIITLNLTILPLPDNSVTQNGITLTANETGITYQWLDCNNSFAPLSGEINQSFVATVNGSYAVEISNNDCADTSDCFVVSTVGVVENTFDHNIMVYPNPTVGNISIDLGFDYDNITLTVQSPNGQKIKQYHCKNQQFIALNLDIPKGVYVMIIESENEKAMLKIMKY